MENYEKKYKEALERMKSWANGEHPECFSEAQKAAEFVFPELAESEDDKIRKELIDFIGRQTAQPNFVEKYNRWIAWLEKQVSKSSFDEHKQEGDRIVTNPDGTRFNLSQLERIAKKESASNEEERIREDIITYMRIANKILPQLSIERWIAWLEKQTPKNKTILDKAVEEEVNAWFEKQNKPKWTEKDEENFRDIIGAIHRIAYQPTEDEEARVEWLKSLKQRLEEQQ